MNLTLRQKRSKPSLIDAFKRASKRLETHRQERRETRIGFVLDATASRELAWREAQQIQARMLGALTGKRNIALRLVHFGGNELSDLGWQKDSSVIAARMAKVSCIAGGTKHLPALKLFLLDNAAVQASAIILVGDMFEEHFDYLHPIAHRLAARQMKVFSFLERNNPSAEKAFKALATITGGKFARFGDELPLSDLCEGVTLLASGDKDAVNRISNIKVKRLLLSGPQK